jgi:hypothetical protein
VKCRPDVIFAANQHNSDSEDELAQPTPAQIRQDHREGTVDTTTTSSVMVVDQPIKLGKPPKFTGGAESLADLLFHCEMEFAVRPATYSSERVKVYYLISHLTGHTFTWARTLNQERSPLLSTFEKFATELQKIHGKSAEFSTAEAESKLEKLKQTKSCSDYAALFDQYTAILKFNDDAKLALFKRGLKPALRTALASLNETFDEYDELRDAAIRIDQQHHQLHTNSPAATTSAGSPQQSSSKNKKRGKDKNNSTTSSNSSTSRGPLTKEEREHRKKNNLCLYCGNAGHIVSNCKMAKKKQPAVNTVLPANIVPPIPDSTPKN